MNLLNSLDVAEFFRLTGTEKQKHRKVMNWLNNGILPRTTTIKIGREVLFVQERIEEFITKKTGV